MEKEVYVKWSECCPDLDRPHHGVIRFGLEGDKFTFETISGNSIETESLVGLLWHYPPLEEFRKAAVACRRKLQWAVKRYDGMSGCSSWYIQHLRKGRICTSDRILHSSMYGKQNEDIKCWIRDIYDVLWDLNRQGCYPNAFSDDSSSDPCGYVDITEEVLAKREAFFKVCHEPEYGFGHDEVDNHNEDDLYKDHLTPTTEENEEDEFV